MKKLMLLGFAALFMAACSDSSTSPAATSRVAPTRRANDDLTCKSGYVIAYDEFGNPYCAPVDGFTGDSTSTTSAMTTSGTTSTGPGRGRGPQP